MLKSLVTNEYGDEVFPSSDFFITTASGLMNTVSALIIDGRYTVKVIDQRGPFFYRVRRVGRCRLGDRPKRVRNRRRSRKR